MSLFTSLRARFAAGRRVPVTHALATTLAILTLHATTAMAVDGVFEINQTCAVDTGCFNGDSAGFPVTITISGSYVLTSNLGREFASGDVNDDRIQVTADDVRLDLNGFAIRCFILVFPGGDTCTGTADGIEATGDRVTVENGSIKGWGGSGVIVGDHSVVRNLTSGLNGRYGIFGSTGTIVQGNNVHDNGIDGISAQQASLVRDNTAHDNGQDGIDVSFTGLVVDNVVYNNTSDGIEASAGGRVTRNVSRSNGGFGLNLSSTVAYSDNTVTDNSTVQGGHNTGGNSCQGSSICP